MQVLYTALTFVLYFFKAIHIIIKKFHRNVSRVNIKATLKCVSFETNLKTKPLFLKSRNFFKYFTRSQDQDRQELCSV